MARSLDSNIYGSDETGMADSISESALANTAGTEDIWGTRTDKRAESHDGADEPQPGDVKVRSIKQDSSGPVSRGSGKK